MSAFDCQAGLCVNPRIARQQRGQGALQGCSAAEMRPILELIVFSAWHMRVDSADVRIEIRGHGDRSVQLLHREALSIEARMGW
jgi:hypothetical protein